MKKLKYFESALIRHIGSDRINDELDISYKIGMHSRFYIEEAAKFYSKINNLANILNSQHEVEDK